MLLPRRLMNGRALMTNFYFNHDPANLPDFSDDCHPVQMFHTHQNDINKHSLVSKQLLQTVRDLGLNVDADAIDLITIATAITAADTFELRDNAENAWARKMHLHVPVTDEDMWNTVEPELSSILNFLTGDQWQFTFEKTTMPMPTPKTSEQAKAKAKSLIELNSVCLFSGGADCYSVFCDEAACVKGKAGAVFVGAAFVAFANESSFCAEYFYGYPVLYSQQPKQGGEYLSCKILQIAAFVSR